MVRRTPCIFRDPDGWQVHRPRDERLRRRVGVPVALPAVVISGAATILPPEPSRPRASRYDRVAPSRQPAGLRTRSVRKHNPCEAGQPRRRAGRVRDRLRKTRANLVPTFDIADCINEFCPWSGKPVQADSLTEFGGRVVGFCNPDCRNRFETAVHHFQQRIDSGPPDDLQRTTEMTTLVTQTPAAEPTEALAHFAARLRFETDCWDVHETLATGTADFVLLDVRSPEAFVAGHIDGAVNLPHATINQERMSSYPSETTFVVYCAGPHCNGANKAAVRIARLGFRVKEMIGGVTGWLDEGFTLANSH